VKLLVSALEHSANIHLKALKKELCQDVEFIGIFDKELGKPLVDIGTFSIMGFVDALKKIRFFINLNKEMARLAADADKVLLIDSSGFNLPLAKKIRKRYPHKEIIYYILPQAWAWKQGRIAVLERTVSRLASILPFEKGFYSKNAPIAYVGHPLLDEISVFKEVPSTSSKVVFMPGSRRSEIAKLMPVFRTLQKSIAAKAVLVVPKHFSKEDIKEVYGIVSEFEITQEVHSALQEADFAFICSGTATLEAALIGTPFVLTYIAKPLDYFLAKRFVKLRHIGLANIMFEAFESKPMHMEFIQEEVTAKNLLHAFESMDKTQFLADSKALRRYLEHGSSKKVASIIEEGI
jgi:lipid-A-disaccharide synthase